MLVACMHDGFKVVRDFEVVKRFDKHTSLAYGVDWKADSSAATGSETLVASCSFYDQSLYLWHG